MHPGIHIPLGRHTPLGRHPPADTSPPGRHPPRQNPPPPSGHCSGRYASYGNAFLFNEWTKNLNGRNSVSQMVKPEIWLEYHFDKECRSSTHKCRCHRHRRITDRTPQLGYERTCVISPMPVLGVSEC